MEQLGVVVHVFNPSIVSSSGGPRASVVGAPAARAELLGRGGEGNAAAPYSNGKQSWMNWVVPVCYSHYEVEAKG